MVVIKIKKGIRSLAIDMVIMSVMSMLLFGMVLLFFCSRSCIEGTVTELEKSTMFLAKSTSQACTLESNGYYSYKNGVLKKGDSIIVSADGKANEVSLFADNKWLDIALYFGSELIYSSSPSFPQHGYASVETAPLIFNMILEGKENVFTQEAKIHGEEFIGSYVPMKNPDDSIIGMIFVGRSLEGVKASFFSTFDWVIPAFIILIFLFAIIGYFYARQIIRSLNKLTSFLGEVAQGNLSAELSCKVLKRSDEIGEIGVFAQTMQSSIVGLIGTDHLTGLYNRYCSGATLDALAKRAQNGTPFCAALADIDSFKAINDTYGHSCGDIVLKRLASIFEAHMSDKGYVFRWGGEEFLFLYENMNAIQVYAELEKLLDEVRAIDIVYGEQHLSFTITVGVQEYRDNLSCEALLEEADKKLYQGKLNRKDQIVM